MKRKWIWLLAIVPLIIGVARAAPAVDSRAHRVVRDFVASDVVISPDGKWIFAALGGQGGEFHRLADGARFKRIWNDSIDAYIGFSPDDQWLYQLDRDSYEGAFGDLGDDFRSPRPDGKIGIIGRSVQNGNKGNIRFNFPGKREDLYGAYLRGDEVIAESRQKTYYLRASDLKIKRTEARNRAKVDVLWLFADGKTALSFDSTRGLASSVDLQTGKTLRNWPIHDGLYGMPARDSDLMLIRESGEIVALDARTGAKRWSYCGPTNQRIWLSPDQSAIYEARSNGELWKWPR